MRTNVDKYDIWNIHITHDTHLTVYINKKCIFNTMRDKHTFGQKKNRHTEIKPWSCYYTVRVRYNGYRK